MDLAQLTERVVELLGRTARGDDKAFARLYRLTAPKLYASALRILKYEDQAQECLQEAFLSIWRHAGRYRRDKAAPTTWMTTIVRNRALDMLRRVHPEESLREPAALELLLDADPEASKLPYDDSGRLLEKCLEQLRDEQRFALELAYYEGLTHPELAAKLDVPLGTVKTWLRRGLERLRNCLK